MYQLPREHPAGLAGACGEHGALLGGAVGLGGPGLCPHTQGQQEPHGVRPGGQEVPKAAPPGARTRAFSLPDASLFALFIQNFAGFCSVCALPQRFAPEEAVKLPPFP